MVVGNFSNFDLAAVRDCDVTVPYVLYILPMISGIVPTRRPVLLSMRSDRTSLSSAVLIFWTMVRSMMFQSLKAIIYSL